MNQLNKWLDLAKEVREAGRDLCDALANALPEKYAQSSTAPVFKERRDAVVQASSNLQRLIGTPGRNPSLADLAGVKAGAETTMLGWHWPSELSIVHAALKRLSVAFLRGDGLLHRTMASDPKTQCEPVIVEFRAAFDELQDAIITAAQVANSSLPKLTVPIVEAAPTMYDELGKWARINLKGKQLRVVELLIEYEGECKVDVMAADTTIDWGVRGRDAGELFRSIQSALNKKLGKARLYWRIERRNGMAMLIKRP